MSWESKQDYAGLATAGSVTLKAVTVNATGLYLEKPGHNGDIVATRAFGVVSAPSCEYAIAASHTYSGLKLGAIATVSSKKFALESIHYETGADAEPTLTAVAREVEAGATSEKGNSFAVPSFTVSPNEIAADPLSAFTLTGELCELTKCTVDIACSVKVHTVNGEAVASDVTMGRIQVALTIGQYGTAEPTVAAADGWDISAPLSCTDPDADLPSWTVTLSKPLTKTVGSDT